MKSGEEKFINNEKEEEDNHTTKDFLQLFIPGVGLIFIGLISFSLVEPTFGWSLYAMMGFCFTPLGIIISIIAVVVHLYKTYIKENNKEDSEWETTSPPQPGKPSEDEQQQQQQPPPPAPPNEGLEPESESYKREDK